MKIDDFLPVGVVRALIGVSLVIVIGWFLHGWVESEFFEENSSEPTEKANEKKSVTSSSAKSKLPPLPQDLMADNGESQKAKIKMLDVNQIS